MPARKFTDAERAAALRMLREGVGTNEIARRVGMSPSTVSWLGKRAGVGAVNSAQTEAAHNANRVAWAQRRAVLIDRFGEVAALLLDRAADGGDSTDAKNLLTAAAIAVDKAQLLSGGATSRHEQLDAQRRRSRVEEISDELAERRSRKEAAGG